MMKNIWILLAMSATWLGAAEASKLEAANNTNAPSAATKSEAKKEDWSFVDSINQNQSF